MYEKYMIQDRDTLQSIKRALMFTYFKNYDKDFLASEQGKVDIEANVFARYNKALVHIVPWVAMAIDLSGKTLIEIGCGTGSSTAAFSHFVKKIDGYDIDRKSVDGARARLEIMDVKNVDLHLVSPENLIQKVQDDHPTKVDIILLYAVLEHQSVRERHETIRSCWDLLNNDGLLVIADTPNLLCYNDYHTSLLPFLHMLPADLYARYAPFSPRNGFNHDFSGHEEMSMTELEMIITRWGRGASYHDFELSLGGDYKKHLACNGFEKEILSFIDTSIEEELLRIYVQKQGLDIPLAFTRVVLNLILKKGSTHDMKLPDPPENKYFITMEQYREGEARRRHQEELLSQMLNSKRWKLSSLLATPYRGLKRLRNRRGAPV